MTSEDYIIEILYKAHNLKLRKKVLKSAINIINNNPKINRLEAFEEAFKEVTKRENTL